MTATALAPQRSVYVTATEASLDAAVSADALAAWIGAYADGDARRLLYTQEALAVAAKLEKREDITDLWLLKVPGERTCRQGEGGEQFYDTISALHKSVRGSYPDASLYWFMRMLQMPEDPFRMSATISGQANKMPHEERTGRKCRT